MPTTPRDLPLEVLSALVDLGAELQAEEVDLPRVLRLATENAARLLGTHIAWLSLYDEAARSMRVAVSHGVTTPGFAEMQVVHGEGLGGAALATGGPVVVADYETWAAPGLVRDAMLREGVASVVCAPLLRGGEAIGVLYVGNRTRTDFSPTEVSVVSALAAQASIAIGNGKLYQGLLEKTRTLQATFEIHRVLGAAAVADLGLERVLATLGGLTGRRLVLEQHVVEPFEIHSEDPQETDPQGTEPQPVATVPVRRDGTDLGTISVFGEPLGELEENALSHGATVLALELMKHEAARAVEWRLRGELLEQLLEAEDVRSPDLVARAARHGIDLALECTLVVIDAPALGLPGLRTLVRRVLDSPASGVDRKTVLSGQRGDRAVVALVGEGHEPARFVEALLDRACGEVVWIGTSGGRPTIAAAMREASACCRLARLAETEGSHVVHGHTLGPLRFMVDMQDLGAASEFVDEVLGAVAAHEERGGARLLTTLRAFIEEDGNHERIAARCHVHVSTVKYRLGRIAELLGRPLQHWETRFEIALAFRLSDLVRAMPERRRPR
ncbi:helix-turn-helix domain-containing protein [Pseudonocardia sulfidoxydans]|uniref:helix-turn-helix domain-containing protein n=1 Tax=Pseudonocardia sulfidoxydans TaxID=54011 RepID=UPI0016499AD9|nr:GAF domain-containing protein [Pseudonocardia sulfidoxydans]